PDATYFFDLLAPSEAEASLHFALAGYSSYPISPDHHLVITMNGVKLGDFWFDGKVHTEFDMTVPVGLLNPEINMLEVILPMDTGAESDMVLLDWVELSFESEFVTDTGSLCFNYGTGTHQFQI